VRTFTTACYGSESLLPTALARFSDDDFVIRAFLRYR